MTPTIVKTPSADGKKDVQKLQRAIIDGLEDVKAQDIQVFDTEHITSLFERVIVASGTSNRQTKALAASVRDAVRDAGFAKPRIEGEDNGEWIIVDCGSAVAHIMQPTIRQYYNLEELWGDKPVKLKLGAPAPLPKAAKPDAGEAAKPTRSRAAAGKKVAAKATRMAKAAEEGEAPPTRTDDGTYVGRVGKTHDWTAKRNAAAPAAEPEAMPVKRTRKAARPAQAVSAPAAEMEKAAVKKAPAKTPVVKVPDSKKVTARKTAAKSAAKKPAVKKVAAKKTARSE